jgi:hypothetical protein
VRVRQRPVSGRARRRAERAGPAARHLDGFDLHANVWVPPNNRVRLEQLCRYLLRPPLVQDRVAVGPEGRVVVRLKAAWLPSRCEDVASTHVVESPRGLAAADRVRESIANFANRVRHEPTPARQQGAGTVQQDHGTLVQFSEGGCVPLEPRP